MRVIAAMSSTDASPAGIRGPSFSKMKGTGESKYVSAADLQVPTSVRLHNINSPFTCEEFDWSLTNKVKMALVGVTIFPIRVGLMIVLLGLGFLIVLISQIGAPKRSEEPAPAWRRALLQPLRLVARGVVWCFGYWYIPVIRKPGSGGARVIVCAPHYSFLDAFYMLYAELPMPIAKADVADLPIFGRAALALQTILVDRQDKESKHKAAQNLKDRARQPGWPNLLIFPEGTTTNGTVFVSFKPGAFAIGEPVQPVVLQYGKKPIDVNGNGPGGGYTHLMLAMLQVVAKTRRGHLLPPVHPDQRHSPPLCRPVYHPPPAHVCHPLVAYLAPPFAYSTPPVRSPTRCGPRTSP